jgi:hypothetical protein
MSSREATRNRHAVQARGSRASRRASLLLSSCGLVLGCSADPGDLFSEPASTSQGASASIEPLPSSVQPSAVSDAAAAVQPVAPPSVTEPSAMEATEPSATEPSAAEATEPSAMEASEPSATEVTEPASDDEPGEGSEGTSLPPPSADPDISEPSADPDPPAQARVCPGVEEPLLLDFSEPGSDSTLGLFGDFQTRLSGGTFVFPGASIAGDGEDQSLGLLSDVTEGDWHISGLVGEPAGFGLFFDCQLIDASRFVGMAFRVEGTLEGADSLDFWISTAANTPSSANDGSSDPSLGRCTPERDELDGTCIGARVEVALSETSRDVLVPFSALRGGRPDATVNPAEITTILWSLPAARADAAGNVEPYRVDLRIDDIRFVEAE